MAGYSYDSYNEIGRKYISGVSLHIIKIPGLLYNYCIEGVTFYIILSINFLSTHAIKLND